MSNITLLGLTVGFITLLIGIGGLASSPRVDLILAGVAIIALTLKTAKGKPPDKK